TVICTPQNVPAYYNTNCSISLINAPIYCQALLNDRYGNLLARPTQVTLNAEAGGVSGPATTDVNGQAVIRIDTQGKFLPVDVAPQPGEYSSTYTDSCGTLTHNPRDGVSTIIALTQGEEDFYDANGNGVYDLGEPFTDLGEPYVDSNDNNVWDPGEYFTDLNANGTWDGPNGIWD